ncbi:MAG TPA: DUF1697 domain-containing protein [Gemmatimonadaceae bacterium]|nr:DUF1697 domain-containing protein [Gemmatimonadaceae bacterium]
MQRYVALIGGLPCGRDGVGMETLRAAFGKLGFLNIETYLTSGNVIFDTSPVGVIGPLEAQISRHLNNSLHTDGVSVFIRTPADLADIISRNPFDATESHSGENLLFVVFLSEPPDERTERQLRIRRNDVDELRLSEREIFWLRRPSRETVAPPDLADILDAPATVRSLSTLVRLVEKCASRNIPAKKPDSSTESARSHP